MNPGKLGDLQFDAANLYREETFTDLRLGSIQRMIPVKADGTDDPSRTARFLIRTQLMSEMGPIPVQAPVEASTLEEAMQKFPEAVKQAVDDMVREAEAAQRERASSLVVPGRGAPPDLKLM